MNNVSYPANDPDFVAAMHEVDDFLKGQPSRFLLLPAPTPKLPALTPFSVPVIEHPQDDDSRADVLARIRILKKRPSPGSAWSSLTAPWSGDADLRI